MADYLRQVRGFRPDIQRFLLYNLLAYVGWGVFQLIFNLYVRELGLREDDMGAFSAAQTVAMAAAAAAMGLVIGRFGIWRCMVGGIAIFLAASFGLALAEHPVALLVLSAADGIGLAYLFTSTMPFIIEWTRPAERQTVAAVAFALIGLSGTLGSLLGGQLPGLLAAEPLVEYRIALLVGTGIATLALIPLFKMGAARRGPAPVDASAERPPESDAERRRTRRDTAVFVLVGGLMAVGAGAVVPFYNVYLTTLGADAQQVGFVFALAGLGAATIGLAAPAVSRRFGALWGVVVVRLAGLPVYALLLLAPSLPIAVVAHVLRQTSISMAWPMDSTFIAEVLPPRARAGVFGLRSAAWNAGYSAASLVAGLVIVRAGYGVTFVALVVFTVLAMGLFAGYYGRHPRVRSGELATALPRGRRVAVAAPAQTASAPAEPAAPPEPRRPVAPEVVGQPDGKPVVGTGVEADAEAEAEAGVAPEPEAEPEARAEPGPGSPAGRNLGSAPTGGRPVASGVSLPAPESRPKPVPPPDGLAARPAPAPSAASPRGGVR